MLKILKIIALAYLVVGLVMAFICFGYREIGKGITLLLVSVWPLLANYLPEIIEQKKTDFDNIEV